MFDRRLKMLLAIFGVALAMIVVRLFELQVVHGSLYRDQAKAALWLRPRWLPFVRGSIVDRTGEVLVRDEPAWSVTVDYDVIAADIGQDTDALKRVLKSVSGRYAQLGDEESKKLVALKADIATSWRLLASLAAAHEGLSIDQIHDRARRTYNRVARVHAAVSRRRGFDTRIAEETQAHPIIERLENGVQIEVRERIRTYPWLHVEPSSMRVCSDDVTSMAHVLGRLGRVDVKTISEDPHAEDPFAAYHADEYVGVSGVEYVAEQALRGRRGQVMFDRGRRVIEEIASQSGEDVQLTIIADLQRRLYQLLGDTVAQVAESSGGAIVVLDVATRETLAMVSYPSYDPNLYAQQYRWLRDQTDSLPLRFRAVANQYAPGSTLKPIACLAGLTSGRITLDTREECTGYLNPNNRSSWRCWAVHGTNLRKAHGNVNVYEALQGSCNVFMYRLGEKVGVDRLCSVFDRVGIGKRSGTGLREEAKGINPTPSWLMSKKGVRANVGRARLFAIGQGEVSMTPVQMANLMATYASGRFRPVSIMANGQPTPEWTLLPGTAAQWRAIRRGIHGVVNHVDGTAYRYARIQRDGYVLSGKTGSASVPAWPTAFRIRFVDANGHADETVVPAGVAHEAIKRFEQEHKGATIIDDGVTVERRWPIIDPPKGQKHAHAWFGGYLQAVLDDGEPDWSREPPIAFAVLVEFGGSGGRVSGPLARDVASTLIDMLGPDFDLRLRSGFSVAIR